MTTLIEPITCSPFPKSLALPWEGHGPLLFGSEPVGRFVQNPRVVGGGVGCNIRLRKMHQTKMWKCLPVLESWPATALDKSFSVLYTTKIHPSPNKGPSSVPPHGCSNALIFPENCVVKSNLTQKGTRQFLHDKNKRNIFTNFVDQSEHKNKLNYVAIQQVTDSQLLVCGQ